MIDIVHTLSKLNYKEGTKLICINAPEYFKAIVNGKIGQNLLFFETIPPSGIDFIMIFVFEQSEIGTTAIRYFQQLEGDAIVWYCYPKKSSKKYSSDISRDNSWGDLDIFHLKGVRMVSIDEDWSAFRFRKAKYIKTTKR